VTTIDRACSNDRARIVAIYNKVLATSNANFDTEPATVESRMPWFDQFAATGPYRLLVAKSEGDVVGYACSGRYREHVAFAQTLALVAKVSAPCCTPR
jgi:phosphinothricin acetyltransferase